LSPDDNAIDCFFWQTWWHLKRYKLLFVLKENAPIVGFIDFSSQEAQMLGWLLFLAETD